MKFYDYINIPTWYKFPRVLFNFYHNTELNGVLTTM